MNGFGKRGAKDGAVAVWVALMLPVLLSAMALVFDVAWLSIVRGYMQSAADHASLAAMQELDLDKLVAGKCVLVEAKAYAAAYQYAWSNLSKNLREDDLEKCDVRIRIYQAGDAGQHGDNLKPGAPSVCIRIELPTRLPVSGVRCVVAVHADASVIGKS